MGTDDSKPFSRLREQSKMKAGQKSWDAENLETTEQLRGKATD